MACRSEGRFSKHFNKEGNPSDLLLLAKQDRLENWKQLQELAGLLDKQKPAAKAGKSSVAKPAPVGGNGHGLPSGFAVGSKIKYDGGQGLVQGVLRSVDPVVLDLEDDSRIEISRDVLREAIALGIVSLQ